MRITRRRAVRDWLTDEWMSTEAADSWCDAWEVEATTRGSHPTGLDHGYVAMAIDRSQPIVSDTSSIRPLYQSPPVPALAPIESWAVLSIRPIVVVDVYR